MCSCSLTSFTISLSSLLSLSLSLSFVYVCVCVCVGVGVCNGISCFIVCYSSMSFSFSSSFRSFYSFPLQVPLWRDLEPYQHSNQKRIRGICEKTIEAGLYNGRCVCAREKERVCERKKSCMFVYLFSMTVVSKFVLSLSSVTLPILSVQWYKRNV